MNALNTEAHLNTVALGQVQAVKRAQGQQIISAQIASMDPAPW